MRHRGDSRKTRNQRCIVPKRVEEEKPTKDEVRVCERPVRDVDPNGDTNVGCTLLDSLEELALARLIQKGHTALYGN